MEKTIEIFAPGSKVIVEVRKGKDDLAFNIEEVTSGKLIAAGDNCTESIREAKGAEVVFGKNRAQVPSINSDVVLLTMEEDNLLIGYSEVSK